MNIRVIYLESRPIKTLLKVVSRTEPAHIDVSLQILPWLFLLALVAGTIDTIAGGRGLSAILGTPTAVALAALKVTNVDPGKALGKRPAHGNQPVGRTPTGRHDLEKTREEIAARAARDLRKECTSILVLESPGWWHPSFLWN
jgi:hypothetical protein